MANLPARIADLTTVLADLKTLLTNCDADIAAQDSDASGPGSAIARIREQAMAAFGAFGESSNEPQ